MKKSLFLGGGSGAAIGAGGSALLYKHEKGKAALKNGIIMTAVGLTVAYFGHKHLEKRDARVRSETIKNFGKHGVAVPNRRGKKKLKPVPNVGRDSLEEFLGDLKGPHVEIDDMWMEDILGEKKEFEEGMKWIIREPKKGEPDAAAVIETDREIMYIE